MATTVFRVEKTRDYTVMSNYHIRDKELSLRAKGLLTLMLSLPEEWDYTLKGLSYICKEKIDAIRAAVNELEAQGYIERRRMRNEKGQLTGTEYVIREHPIAQVADRDKPKSETPVLEKPTLENPILDNPTLAKPTLATPTLATPTLGNPTQLNIDKTNIDLSNTDAINYQSINQREQAVEENNNEQNSDRWIDRYNQNIELIKKNIDYDALLYGNEKSLVDEIVTVMAEVLTVDTPYYTIEKRKYPTELVRQRFLAIDNSKLEAFLLEFTQRSERIYNTKAYLITSLFNAPATAETKLSNMVMHDMRGG